MADITMNLNEVNIKLQAKGISAFALLEEVVCFGKKINYEISNQIVSRLLKKKIYIFFR